MSGAISPSIPVSRSCRSADRRLRDEAGVADVHGLLVAAVLQLRAGASGPTSLDLHEQQIGLILAPGSPVALAAVAGHDRRGAAEDDVAVLVGVAADVVLDRAAIATRHAEPARFAREIAAVETAGHQDVARDDADV